MSILGRIMQMRTLHLEDFEAGMPVLTPSGKRAIVVKTLAGASKRDLCDRVIVKYEGGHAKDLVTLQPHQLRLAEPVRVPVLPLPNIGQLAFAF